MHNVLGIVKISNQIRRWCKENSKGIVMDE